MKALAVAALCAALWSPAVAGEQEVTIERNGLSLHGTFLSVPGDSERPAVLLIAGSGPTDRDGNSAIPGVKPATLKLIAEGLAQNGISSLRFDKRGVGASAMLDRNESALRLSTYVDDTVAWAQYLDGLRHVRCVVIAGHSEGALIGALAAAKTKTCGYISMAGAGFPADDVILAQLKEHGAPQALQSEAGTLIARIRKGDIVADVSPQLAPIFRPGVQPYLASWFAVDPAAALNAITVPSLILQGTNDIQVAMINAERLAKSATRGKLVRIDGANHVLKSAPKAIAANMATYSDPALPLAPGVLPAIVNFVKSLP